MIVWSQNIKWQDICTLFVLAHICKHALLTLTVLVTPIDAQWEGMGDVGSARYYNLETVLAQRTKTLSNIRI